MADVPLVVSVDSEGNVELRARMTPGQARALTRELANAIERAERARERRRAAPPAPTVIATNEGPGRVAPLGPSLRSGR